MRGVRATGGLEPTDGSSSVDGPEGPFFGDMGEVIRVRRTSTDIQRDLPRYSPLLLLALVLVMVYIDIVLLEYDLWVFFVLLFLAVLLFIYYGNKEPRTARLLELSRDGAVLSYDDGSPGTIASIRFGPETVVSVVLNEHCRSEEFGHLYGWTLRDGDQEIQVSAHEGWELWDIQSLRAPIYRLMEHHGMGRGPELAYYQEGMRGVVPIRGRHVSEVSP